MVANIKDPENGFLKNIEIYLDLKPFEKIQYGCKVTIGSSKKFGTKFLQNLDWQKYLNNHL